MALVEATYREFAAEEARGSSPIYESLALAVAEDDAACRFLASLPPGKQQPNLLFGALRWFEVPVEQPALALRWLREHQDEVRAVIRSRMTQTNEVARCAVLLPALAQLPEPLALVEVGASAGLCLLYDAWSYWYRGDGIDLRVGDAEAPLTLECRVGGAATLPTAVPGIAWRAGLDLNPIDVTDPDARRWLGCLVWPEHKERTTRLGVAMDVAAKSGVRVQKGSLTDDLDRLLDELPAGATPVVVHSATLTYVAPNERDAFVDALQRRGVHRVGAEGASVLPALTSQLPDGVDPQGRFLLSLDDRVLALVGPHGGFIDWL